MEGGLCWATVAMEMLKCIIILQMQVLRFEVTTSAWFKRGMTFGVQMELSTAYHTANENTQEEQ